MSSNQDSVNPRPYDVVVLGAGYAGLMAALRLRRHKTRLRIVLVNSQDQFVERVRLQESIVAVVTPRIRSITAFLAGTAIEFICGNIISLDPNRRCARITTDREEQEILFDQLVVALGSQIDVDEVPGAAEHAYRLEPGAGPRSAAALRSRLQQDVDRPACVVVVGGGETGIEVAGEIKTAWPAANVTIISRSRCGGFRGQRVAFAIRAQLTRLGVTLIDGETVCEVHARELKTESGRSIDYDICVWSGGLRSSLLPHTVGIATDPRGRIWVDPTLRSISHPQILAVGDAAHPIAPTSARYRMSAFAALVSGAYAADVILAQRKEQPIAPFSFSTFGQGIAIGRGGVGFSTYPDDRQSFFVVKGGPARKIRNFFVWLVTYVLKIERRVPGFFSWPGKGRVSWAEANEAMESFQRREKALAPVNLDWKSRGLRPIAADS